MKRLLILFLGISVSAVAGDFASMPAVRAIAKGQPTDVASLIERIAECKHWGGEEPYDAARAEQIKQAGEEAGCLKLDADEAAIRKKYRKRKSVVSAIEKAKAI